MCSRSSMRSLQDIKVRFVASSNTAFLLVVCTKSKHQQHWCTSGKFKIASNSSWGGGVTMFKCWPQYVS